MPLHKVGDVAAVHLYAENSGRVDSGPVLCAENLTLVDQVKEPWEQVGHDELVEHKVRRGYGLFWKLLKLDRLPTHSGMEGLRLLRHAWDEFDICDHHAVKYKSRSQVVLWLAIVLASGALCYCHNGARSGRK